jgi:hypothetical protein
MKLRRVRSTMVKLTIVRLPNIVRLTRPIMARSRTVRPRMM